MENCVACLGGVARVEGRLGEVPRGTVRAAGSTVYHRHDSPGAHDTDWLRSGLASRRKPGQALSSSVRRGPSHMETKVSLGQDANGRALSATSVVEGPEAVRCDSSRMDSLVRSADAHVPLSGVPRGTSCGADEELDRTEPAFWVGLLRRSRASTPWRFSEPSAVIPSPLHDDQREPPGCPRGRSRCSVDLAASICIDLHRSALIPESLPLRESDRSTWNPFVASQAPRPTR